MTYSASLARKVAALFPGLAMLAATALVFAACNDEPLAPEPSVSAAKADPSAVIGVPLSWDIASVEEHRIGVWGTSANSVFAVGFGGFISHFNGTAWTAMTTGTTAST